MQQRRQWLPHARAGARWRTARDNAIDINTADDLAAVRATRRAATARSAQPGVTWPRTLSITIVSHLRDSLKPQRTIALLLSSFSIEYVSARKLRDDPSTSAGATAAIAADAGKGLLN
jgi:hypothetical protein